MTAITNEIDYHIRELQQVATGLRRERTLGPAAESLLRRIRMTVGEALVQLGTAVAVGNRPMGSQAR